MRLVSDGWSVGADKGRRRSVTLILQWFSIQVPYCTVDNLQPVSSQLFFFFITLKMYTATYKIPCHWVWLDGSSEQREAGQITVNHCQAACKYTLQQQGYWLS